MNLITLKEKICNNYSITLDEAISLIDEDLETLCTLANEIREHFCGNKFDICTIVNAKSGRCSEDCKYCSQSIHYKADCKEYPLLSKNEILASCTTNAQQGVMRYSLVTSGKNLSDNEIDKICDMAESMKEIPIKLCGSFGLLRQSQYEKLYKAGIKSMHNNLETSEQYFPTMCSTHSWEDKVTSISKAKSAGMYVCSGGIIGIGESFEDRINLAFSLKALNIQSIPLNMLTPIKGTPYGNMNKVSERDFKRTIAIFRFILPYTFIRLAGGRGLMSDAGYSLFSCGANATITGDLLTTAGISIKDDIKNIKSLGFDITSTPT